MSEGLLPNLVSNPAPVFCLLSLESCSMASHCLAELGSPLVLYLWPPFGCRTHLSEGKGRANPQSRQKIVLVCRLVFPALCLGVPLLIK